MAAELPPIRPQRFSTVWLSSSFKAKCLIQARARWTREEVLSHQQQRFKQLLTQIWSHSPFYRDFYSAHGLTEGSLSTVSVRDLPIIDKETLMANFDRISPDPLLRRDPIEDWIDSGASETAYRGRYIIVHTSGTSGAMGIFAYDRSAWAMSQGMVVARAGSRYRYNPFHRNRIAYYGATHGRFAGVTTARGAPRALIDMQLCSVLDPISQVIDQLNRFQPEHLYGYPSALAALAQHATSGSLRIRPHFVFSAGELLTPEAIEAIESAWGAKPFNSYACSESLCLALQRRDGLGLSLMEDENLVEILDENDEPVKPGESGRVVLTSLYNRALPIVRYDLKDYATRGERHPDEAFDTLLRINGRANDALPVLRANDTKDSVHPIVLSEFFVPGLRKFQFISHSDRHASIRYVAEEEIGESVRRAFERILEMKGAHPAFQLTVDRANDLPADPTTGKYRLVVHEDAREPVVHGSG